MFRKQSTMANNHTELALWTTRVDSTLASLTRQFAEKVGALVNEEGEWDMTEEQQQSVLPM